MIVVSKILQTNAEDKGEKGDEIINPKPSLGALLDAQAPAELRTPGGGRRCLTASPLAEVRSRINAFLGKPESAGPT